MSQIVIADNLAALHVWAGLGDGALEWQGVYEQLCSQLEMPSEPSRRWLELYRARLELRQAIDVAQKGLEVAEKLLDPGGADLFAAELGDLHYRLGEPDRALSCFRRALTISRRIASPEQLWGTAIGCAFAAMRAGALDEALALLEALLFDSHPDGRELLAHKTAEASEARAELYASCGVIHARRGDAPASEAAINQAIELAVGCGERDVLLRVACAAGESCLALDRGVDAKAAFMQALELARTSEPPQPADLVALAAGAFAAGIEDQQLTTEALAVLSDALADAESWWHLDRLGEAARALPVGPDIELLRKALAQRSTP